MTGALGLPVTGSTTSAFTPILASLARAAVIAQNPHQFPARILLTHLPSLIDASEAGQGGRWCRSKDNEDVRLAHEGRCCVRERDRSGEGVGRSAARQTALA
jgi:hypothetical protein